jgi:hypothetical protein
MLVRIRIQGIRIRNAMSDGRDDSMSSSYLEAESIEPKAGLLRSQRETGAQVLVRDSQTKYHTDPPYRASPKQDIPVLNVPTLQKDTKRVTPSPLVSLHLLKRLLGIRNSAFSKKSVSLRQLWLDRLPESRQYWPWPYRPSFSPLASTGRRQSG